MLRNGLALGVVFVGLAAAASSYAGQVGVNVIYGEDNRLDLYQVTDANLTKLADSTVALISTANVTFKGDRAELKTTSFAEDFGLCDDEPFFHQSTAAFCSGSLVGEDLLLTAGHCISHEPECADTYFVFGFAVTKEGEYPSSVAATDVYACGGLVGRYEDGDGADWALVRLDRKVTGHAPLEINRTNTIDAADELVVIGHPSGLPTKVAAGAHVRDFSPNGFFVANLDTYAGNSGSAVFNLRTGMVEGVLVRGETDFRYDGARACRRSYVCENAGCRGEDVTKISAASHLIPQF